MAQTITQKNPSSIVGVMSTGRILDTGTVEAMTLILG